MIIGVLLVISSVLFLFSRMSLPARGDEGSFVDISAKKLTQFVLEGGRVPFEVSLAQTPQERAQGLSGTAELLPHTGKFFIFETLGMYGFWMKDMRFSIDIIWIDENFIIVGIEQGVAPSSYPDVFYPPVPVRYVLEVRSGEAIKNNLNIGTKVKLIEK